MYFSNSHERRDFPIPATPTTDTRRARDSSALAWNRSLTSRSSAARPTNGASSPVERRPDCSLRVVLSRDGSAPHRHHRVADELLHRPAVAFHDGAGRLEVARLKIAHVLEVPPLREGGVADEVCKKHRDQPSLCLRR